jgi:spectinomycin phosphotransferase/16S rRNA (guanine(1405)-N(7))-methyltransferase
VGRVLTPPDGLDDEVLMTALRRCWGLNVTSLSYLAVGWGSHHWAAAGAVHGGVRPAARVPGRSR